MGLPVQLSATELINFLFNVASPKSWFQNFLYTGRHSRPNYGFKIVCIQASEAFPSDSCWKGDIALLEFSEERADLPQEGGAVKVKQWHKGKDQQWNQDTVPCVSRLRIPHMQYWVQPVLFLHRTSHMRGRGERGLVQCFCLVSQPVKSFWLAYSFLWPYAVLAIINNARDCFQLEKMRSVYSAILSAYLSATECSV